MLNGGVMMIFWRYLIIALALAYSGLAVAQLAQQSNHPALQALSPTHPCGHGNQPPCPPPPPPPVTLSISFDPAMPTIPDNTPIGTVLTHITVTMSDGSIFTGSLGFGTPYGSDSGVCALQGMEVLLGAVPPDGVQNCTITATQ
jgi:hypothetical protein